jgi:hypothetical protein
MAEMKRKSPSKIEKGEIRYFAFVQPETGSVELSQVKVESTRIDSKAYSPPGQRIYKCMRLNNYIDIFDYKVLPRLPDGSYVVVDYAEQLPPTLVEAMQFMIRDLFKKASGSH